MVMGIVMAPTYLLSVSADEPLPETVEFSRDIRPIFSDTCFECHGPDEQQRDSELRLDIEAEAFKKFDDHQTIVPGDSKASELYRRITTSDDDERMPPSTSDRQLTSRQTALIERWIEQGAKWQKHWSFVPPRRKTDSSDKPPARVDQSIWVRNPIDAYILARLEREGLAPSSEASRTTLIRRVTLDLTGLPPTPEEVDAFLNDDSPRAYENVVDRLLTTERYAERMASRWLDAARYADTNGYQTDGVRHMWRWRDWVIDAFHKNMPFDRFTIEQIAGDMLPGATLDQIIATGFNRNHRGNGEGGIIPEEYAVEYVVDRVETTSTVWLGLTMGCARCHDHKYDPVSQTDFYRMFAYFNNVPERGKAFKVGNSAPTIAAPTRAQQDQLAELDQRLDDAESAFLALQSALVAEQAAWEKSFHSDERVDWSVSKGQVAHYELDDDIADVSEKAPAAQFKEGEPKYAPGQLGTAAEFDGKRFIEAGDVANFGYRDRYSFGAWIFPRDENAGTILSRVEDGVRPKGYSFVLDAGRLNVNLVVRWLDDALRVRTESKIEPNRWQHVLFTYDGSRMAEGVRIYVDGRPQQIEFLINDLNQEFKNAEPLRFGAGGGQEQGFDGLIDELQIYDRAVSDDEAALIATADSLNEIIAVPADKRGAVEAAKLRAAYLDGHASEKIRDAHNRLNELRDERQAFVESLPTVMIMRERETSRPTHVLERGRYDKPGKEVSPGVPENLPPLPDGVPNNRLGFARWLVDPSNPLSARVTVNRFWQMYFGAGLVRTVEDFGSQGASPTHPELLDWLATEFIRLGWDVKAMQKTIVMSATYRQSSDVMQDHIQLDPLNRLLARGPRVRLSAQMVRDQALAVGGLLVEQVGGPSVKPYQPAGLWKELASVDYVPGKGDDLYRRSLYTFWKRTVGPPTMMTFDASPRETCVVRETRTNTPLQALALMNDVTFVEAARGLAERLFAEADDTREDRLALAFRLATARYPSDDEMAVLIDGFQTHLAAYRDDVEAAKKLISVGETKPDGQLDPSELAAYTAVAGLILNLDEVVMKN